MSVIHYGTPPFTYVSGESGSPLGGDSAGAFSGAEPSGKDFFPRFEAIASGSSEAVFFFPWIEEFLIPPFLKASFTEAVASLFPPFAFRRKRDLQHPGQHGIRHGLGQGGWTPDKLCLRYPLMFKGQLC